MSNMRNSGTILVFLGAVFWSLNAPLVKFLTADPLLICGLRFHYSRNYTDALYQMETA